MIVINTLHDFFLRAQVLTSSIRLIVSRAHSCVYRVILRGERWNRQVSKTCEGSRSDCFWILSAVDKHSMSNNDSKMSALCVLFEVLPYSVVSETELSPLVVNYPKPCVDILEWPRLEFIQR